MSVQLRVLKFIDAVVGRAMASLFPPPGANKESQSPESFLIIRPGGIGDAVLLIPALQTLKNRFPDARFHVLAERRNAAVFKLYSGIFQTFCYDKPAELLAALRGNYDYVIDTEQSHYLSAIIARLTKSVATIGFASNNRKRLFNYALPYEQEDYEAFSFFRLLEPFGIKLPQPFPKCFLNIPESDRFYAVNLASSTPFVCIFPGASVSERRWGGERFHELTGLLCQYDISVVVIGGSSEEEVGDQIVGGTTGRNLAGKTTISQTAAIIEKSSLLVTADSGMLHLAVGLDKPTVSLFGPGRHKKWAPKGDRHIVLNKNLQCSPCTTFGSTPKCLDDARCMKEITVDEVFKAVTTLLTQEGVLQKGSCKSDITEIA